MIRRFWERFKNAIKAIKASPQWPLIFISRFDKFYRQHSVGPVGFFAGFLNRFFWWLNVFFTEKVMDNKSGQAFWVIRNRKGQKFLIRNLHDELIPIFMIIHSIWHRYPYSINRFYKLQKGDIVLDIGAHIGIYAVYAESQGAKVYAYEPEPENFAVLQKNIKLNNCSNIIAFCEAAGGKPGKRLLYSFPTDSTAASFFENSDPIHKPIKSAAVEAKTLAQMLEQNGLDRVDLLKVDCEGAEYEFLFETPPSVFQKIRNLSIEYHRGAKPILDFLQNLGFECREKTNWLSSDYGTIWAWYRKDTVVKW